MAVLKCKMCGGDLNIQDNVTVAECEYCGTTQTIPTADNEKKMTLFARANKLRLNCEFDKAAGVYESIVTEFSEEAEAYWGLVLCKYGIEYVDDPATGKKVPTCHRSSFDRVIDDNDYDMAIECADSVAKKVYKDEAKAIEEIRRGIIEVSSKEEPYDIFICYKETDENGERTIDSVMAQDVYDALTDKGYRVFFSRITLEDKLGQEYEPYIFAALNSAKVMLVFGTDEDYFNAVWVKNEWARFLHLIANGEKKTVIPCYKNIDPYYMPKEFAKLQSQDMGKVGAIQDLVRGVEKVLGGGKIQAKEKEIINVGSNPSAGYLERAEVFLQDREYERAIEYFDKALDGDSKNSKAYLGKVMAYLSVNSLEELINSDAELDNNKDYERAIRYADEDLKKKLQEIKKTINESFLGKGKKSLQLRKYNDATEYFDKAINAMPQNCDAYIGRVMTSLKVNSLEALSRLAVNLDEYDDFTAAVKYADESFKKELQELNDKTKRNFVIKGNQYLKQKEFYFAKKNFDKAAVIMPENSEAYMGKLMSSLSVSSLEELFETRNNFDYFDSYKKAIQYGDDEFKEKLNNLKLEAEKKKAIKTAKYKKNGTIVVILIISVIIIGIIAYNLLKLNRYNKAVDLMNNEQYNEALSNFMNIEGFRDSKEKVKEIANYIYLKNLTITAGNTHTVGLKSDGTVVATGSYHSDVENWADIIAITAGNAHTVGLKSDGTVVATGENGFGQCDVENWTDIIAIAAGGRHTVGLKSDGTVVATGYNDYGQCDVENWKNITAISVGELHTVGLKGNGTVVATGKNSYGQCNVEDWTDIIAIAAGEWHTVGLKSDGTVVATGENDYEQCDVKNWKNIIAVATGTAHTVGLKGNGTLVTTGSNYDEQCNVEDWTDIIAIAAGEWHTVGLKSDGTVVATGKNSYGQCNVESWNNIKVY